MIFLPHTLRVVGALLAACAIVQLAPAMETKSIDIRSYPTLQAAIDANPGGILVLPPGEYAINAALTIRHDDTELHGPARIVQTNPRQPILSVENAKRVRVSNLAFTRSPGQQEAETAGLLVMNCDDVELSQLRVSENHSHTSIRAHTSRNVTIQGCTVTNYKGLAIDDRTRSELYGYAFKAIDGTGIQLVAVHGGVIRDNRVLEHRLLPTKETRDKYDLGAVTILPPDRRRLLSQSIFETKYTNNWHQGSGIHVSGSETSARVIISGNYLENPAQGLDLHADNVIVTNNFVSHAMIGMKAMHGAKNILIDGNQFSHVDLWGVLLMPGASSHRSANAEGDKKGASENVDGGSIISNNIFSNFGFGEQHWNWEAHKGSTTVRNVIIIQAGQLEENPPIRNVLISGNVVYDSGQDTMLQDGRWAKEPPRYRYALYVEQKKAPAPVNVQVYGNLFDSGFDGVSNLPETHPSERASGRSDSNSK